MTDRLSPAQMEEQYWSDVVALRPVEQLAARQADSRRIRKGYQESLAMPYGTDPRQQVDVLRPDGQGPWPVLAFIHGGYWQLGCKEDWAYLAPGWTARGVAVANIGYRLLPDVTLSDIVADIDAALAWLRDNADALLLNTDRLVLTGISAGAHLAAMAATGTSPPRALALLSGVHDPRALIGTTPGKLVAASLPASLDEISPLGRPAPCDCTAIIAWGDDETTVFEHQSKLLHHYWAALGVSVPTVAVPGKNHYSIADCLLPEHGCAVSQFLVDHL